MPGAEPNHTGDAGVPGAEPDHTGVAGVPGAEPGDAGAAGALEVKMADIGVTEVPGAAEVPGAEPDDAETPETELNAEGDLTAGGEHIYDALPLMQSWSGLARTPATLKVSHSKSYKCNTNSRNSEDKFAVKLKMEEPGDAENVGGSNTENDINAGGIESKEILQTENQEGIKQIRRGTSIKKVLKHRRHHRHRHRGRHGEIHRHPRVAVWVQAPGLFWEGNLKPWI